MRSSATSFASPALPLFAAALLLSTVMVAWSLYRDFGWDRNYPMDLRNRVVGARIIHDGGQPYFYHWKEGDGSRYYDPFAFYHIDTVNGYKASLMTASPFFQQLIDPIAELPQKQINVWWRVIQYLLFGGMVWMGLLSATTPVQKSMVLLLPCLFLLTEAWKQGISTGQYYCCMPFLAMVIYRALKKQGYLLWAAIGGTAAILLLLIRPNTLFFFPALLLLAGNYSGRWLAVFFTPIVLLAGWSAADKRERLLWEDYRLSLAEQIRIHQQLQPALQKNVPDPRFPEFEGIAASGIYPRREIQSENANPFYLFTLFSQRKIPVASMLLISLTVIAALGTTWFYRHGRAGPADTNRVVMLGFCLYMISDLTNPVYRYQYNTVQWLFPLILAASALGAGRKRVCLLMLTGVLLNISKISFIKMEHTLGEWIILLAAIIFAFQNEPKRTDENSYHNRRRPGGIDRSL